MSNKCNDQWDSIGGRRPINSCWGRAKPVIRVEVINLQHSDFQDERVHGAHSGCKEAVKRNIPERGSPLRTGKVNTTFFPWELQGGRYPLKKNHRIRIKHFVYHM